MGPQIIVDYRDFPLGSASSVCLGNFDGVHLGHQEILRGCQLSAKRYGLVSVAFTFFPHPTKILQPALAPPLLLTREERRELLGMTGVNWILEQNFSADFSKISAEKFATEVLFGGLNAKSIVVGSNFRFGFRAQGNADLLKSQTAFDTTVVESVKLGGEADLISSSRIRELVQLGRVEIARELLGYPYFMTGVVVHGARRGHELGFPTANLKSTKECLPARGVYLSVFQDLETKNLFASVTNIGSRPTLEVAGAVSIESHLLDFASDLYEKPSRLFFISRLRDEVRFESLTALRQQIEADVQKGKDFFIDSKLMQTPTPQVKRSVKSPDPLLRSFQPFEKIAQLANS